MIALDRRASSLNHHIRVSKDLYLTSTRIIIRILEINLLGCAKELGQRLLSNIGLILHKGPFTNDVS